MNRNWKAKGSNETRESPITAILELERKEAREPLVETWNPHTELWRDHVARLTRAWLVYGQGQICGSRTWGLVHGTRGASTSCMNSFAGT